MRIVTGSARGIALKTLEGDATRPTPAVVKEAVFSSIQFDIEGRRVIDLFAGSGQMGLEALSRGAEKATFVDASREATAIITENAQKTKLYKQSNVLCMDFKEYLRSAAGRNTFDIVFLDPPYDSGFLPEILVKLYDGDIVTPESIIICESGSELDTADPMIAERYEVKKVSRYSRVYVTYLIPKSEAEND